MAPVKHCPCKHHSLLASNSFPQLVVCRLTSIRQEHMTKKKIPPRDVTIPLNKYPPRCSYILHKKMSRHDVAILLTDKEPEFLPEGVVILRQISHLRKRRTIVTTVTTDPTTTAGCRQSYNRGGAGTTSRPYRPAAAAVTGFCC